MDVLSDVLRTVRLQGALFIHGEFREPWCVNAPRAGDFAAALCPGAQQLAILHLVLQGRCWMQLQGQAPVALQTGDAAVLPQGDAHLIGSGLGHAPVDLSHVVPVEFPRLALAHYGGEGDPTLLVCGWFAFERDIANPLVEALPRLFCAAVGSRPAGPWLEQSLRYVLQEAAGGQPGSGAMAAKVAESLFVEALRGYIDTLPPQQSGWLAGLRDPQIGRCLALMHTRPQQDWSVEDLARAVHMSRSVLAERFTDLLGLPPMQYLRRWRLATAARMLCNERCSLGQVAQAVGYESEASFSRAFKGEYGVAPGQWRTAGTIAPAAPPPLN